MPRGRAERERRRNPATRDAPSRGPLVELEVERLAVGGEGVARLADGKVAFVRGALPGERVVARILEARKRFVRAAAEQVVRRSDHRRDDDCVHAVRDACGGCGWRHVADAEGVALKARATVGELRKLAPGIAWPDPVLHAVAPHDGSRARLRLHIRQRALGFFRSTSHDLVAVERCVLATPAVQEAMGAVARTLRGLEPDHGLSGVTLEEVAGRVYAAFAGTPSAVARAALSQCVGEGELAGVVFDDSVPAMVVSRAEVRGHSLLDHGVVGAFAQATPVANQALRELVFDTLQASEAATGVVADLYAGSGNLTLVAALIAARVVAIELEGHAVDALRAAREANGMRHVEALAADLAPGLPAGAREACRDMVILDPPRAGAPGVVLELAALRPRLVVYVSCAPTVLARDVTTLGPAFEVAALHALDMFPRTPHLEMVAVLRRI